MAHLSNNTSVYDAAYAASYEQWYLYSFAEKHQLNIAFLTDLLQAFPKKNTCWLDTFCGQAWHFAQFGNNIDKTGIDISPAQIERARQRNPESIFIVGDVLEVSLPFAKFDLTTNFWASYSYLNSHEKIMIFLERICRWTKPGGTIYLEVLIPEYLELFNLSPFSNESGFKAYSKTADFVEWYYLDNGGRHEMTSPPVSFFTNLLSQYFPKIEIQDDDRFMAHVFAKDKNS